MTPELFLYFLTFMQSEGRFHCREHLRNSILRRHVRVLPAETSYLEDLRILHPLTRLAIRNPQRYPLFEMIFSMRGG
jgi:hypothetical protein